MTSSPPLEIVRDVVSKATTNATTVVPVWKEWPLTAFPGLGAEEVYLAVSTGVHSMMFECSLETDPKALLHSIVAADPWKVMTCGTGEGQLRGDPLCHIQSELSRWFVPPEARLEPAILNGAAFGYIGYDAVKYFEPCVAATLAKQVDALEVPEAVMMFYNSFVIINHAEKTLRVVALSLHKQGESFSEEAYNSAVARIDELLAMLNQPKVRSDFVDEDGTTYPAVSNAGDNGYHAFVGSLRKNIISGDIIQAVPSHRLRRKIGIHPWTLYKELRALNPSRYGFFIECDGFQILGSSPELLVKVKDGLVTNHPIAGTRKRGKSKEEDQAFAKELLDDEKERAEHIMLVDLGRNDVNRNTLAETTKVDSLMHIEMFSHVMHIVSCVTGKLRPECSSYDAFRSIFPAGTVSGAPKLKAIELVASLEKEKRGVYAGSIGYFSLSGEIDTCIAIRTMLVKDGHAYLQAGGGIVYDSQEEAEYQETMNKMAALGTAITNTEVRFRSQAGESSPQPIASIKHETAAGEKLNKVFAGVSQSPAPTAVVSQAPTTKPRGTTTLMIDNYDSFTWNLYQYLSLLGENVIVHRNDQITVEECLALKPDHVVISPGPCDPSSAGISKDVIQAFLGKVPILGVCLGHECLVELLGGNIVYAGEIMHGKTSLMTHDSKGIYEGIEEPFKVIRYHSLAAKTTNIPEELEVVSMSDTGVIMGVRHKKYRVEGVQYHPESIKTENGLKMLENFLSWKDGSW